MNKKGKNMKRKAAAIVISIILLSSFSTLGSTAYSDDERAWSSEDWKVTGPDTIIGGPSLSGGEDSMYLSGAIGDVFRLYEVVPEEGYPSTTFEDLDSRPTAAPQVYPEKGNTGSAYTYWSERVYVGDVNGTLYRLDKYGNVFDMCWKFHLSDELERQVSITQTPLIAEREDIGDLLAIVTTENSIHAVRDDEDGGTPTLVWNRTLETEGELGTINQPDIFNNVRNQEEMDTDKVIVVTTSLGFAFTLDYGTGSMIWSDNIAEYTGRGQYVSEPVVPFYVKKGDVNEQYFYVIIDDLIAAVHLYPMIDEDLVDIIDINSDTEEALTPPEISSNGKLLWFSSYTSYGSTIYQISMGSGEYGYDWNVDWRYNLNESVRCRPTYNKKNDLLYAVSEEGTMYCMNTWGEGLSEYGDRIYWEHHIGGKPKSIHLLPMSINRNFLTPVIMIIHEGPYGGAEGWKAVEGGTEPYYNLDPFLFGDTIFSLCFWVFMMIWLVTIAITFALYMKRKRDEKKPPWPPDYMAPK